MNLLTRRGFVGMLGGAALAEAPARPNIIFVLMDDLGFGEFGPHQYLVQPPPLPDHARRQTDWETAKRFAAAATPTLSRLVKQGALFTDAYAACPVCAPSRTAILTAKYPQRFGIFTNEDVLASGAPPREFVTPLFAKNGYRTAAIGKWHLSPRVAGVGKDVPTSPLNQGFQYFFGFDKSGTQYYDSEILMRNTEPAKAQGFTTDQFAGEAEGFIHASGREPFFLYLAFNAVHGPLGRPAPERYLSQFQSGNRPLDNFYAYVLAADTGIRRLLDAVEASGRLDDTVVIFSSDNGAPGAHPTQRNAPFRGVKGQIWQGGVRMPLLVWSPKRICGGQILDEPVSLMDILPTALDAAGIPLPDACDGKSLLPRLTGRESGPVHEAVFAAGLRMKQFEGEDEERVRDFQTAPPGYFVRQDRWVLQSWADQPALQLFDIREDPYQTMDRAAQLPEVVKRLNALYTRWYQTTSRPARMPESQWRKMAPR